jgi:hypothetical protein
MALPKQTDDTAWAINNHSKSASNIAAQHAHVERFQRRDGSILAPKRDHGARFMMETHLRFPKD